MIYLNFLFPQLARWSVENRLVSCNRSNISENHYVIQRFVLHSHFRGLLWANYPSVAFYMIHNCPYPITMVLSSHNMICHWGFLLTRSLLIEPYWHSITELWVPSPQVLILWEELYWGLYYLFLMLF